MIFITLLKKKVLPLFFYFLDDLPKVGLQSWYLFPFSANHRIQRLKDAYVLEEFWIFTQDAIRVRLV